MIRRGAAFLVAALFAFSSLPALAEGLSGAGSTFAHPLLARWGQVYASLQGDGGSAFAITSVKLV